MAVETERLTIFIAPELNTAIRVQAAKQRKTLSDFATQAFDFYLNALEAAEEDQEGQVEPSPKSQSSDVVGVAA